jgi:hypothetical protein
MKVTASGYIPGGFIGTTCNGTMLLFLRAHTGVWNRKKDQCNKQIRNAPTKGNWPRCGFSLTQQNKSTACAAPPSGSAVKDWPGFGTRHRLAQRSAGGSTIYMKYDWKGENARAARIEMKKTSCASGFQEWEDIISIQYKELLRTGRVNRNFYDSFRFC